MMGHPYEISEAAEKDWQRIVAYSNLVFKCRINKLSLSKVYKGEKSLHSLPRVAIALAEAQAMVLFFNA